MRTEATPDRLATTTTGDGPAVVVLHGFAQTGACLGPLVDDLAEDHRVVLPDAPGHGGSLRHAGVDLVGGAALLAATVGPATGGPATAAGDRPPVVIGYSMGGRLALTLAVHHPDAVGALVLIGATAGIEDPVQRAERAAADAALADRLESIGVDAFLQEWLALPLFAGLPEWARFDDERRANTAAGLAASLRHAGTGAMAPLWDRAGELSMPVLCLAGERDGRYAALAERLAGAVGANARAAVVPGAGHAAHLEAPGATVELIRGFLAARRDPPGRPAPQVDQPPR